MYMAGSLPSRMGRDAYGEWRMLLDVQKGIVTRQQASRLGFSDRQIEYRVKSGQWQRVHPGVYATFSGLLSRDARLWAAVLWAGKGAMLSHETAAEVQGIIDKPLGNKIHITVSLRRRPAQLKAARGIAVHRSAQSQAQFLGPFNLPGPGLKTRFLI